MKSGAPVVLPHIFDYQSWFNTTNLAKAIAVQAAGQIIASTTKRSEDLAGYGVGLDPMSETPVALEFKGTSSKLGTSPVILKPGQVLFPFGREADDHFQGFDWGLPYGWLGGGLGRLNVFRSPRAEVDWSGRPEIIIQRQRMEILAAGADLVGYNTAASVPRNWPTMFPPLGLQRAGTQAVNQAGHPAIAVEPTKIVMRLNTPFAALASASTVRFLMYGTKGLDTTSTGALDTTYACYEDVTFPVLVEKGINATPKQSSVVVLSGDRPLVRLGCDLSAGGGVIAIDYGDGEILGGMYLDIIRYGRL
ncbi:MAG: hypothetical protein WC729_29315 [Sphingomonas sp.]|jgi:hypothetical protein|uniref:hypothetical protein n=1 Tax=Sphingomonas sp. TaxID=28214 RepID=UPI003567BC7D